MQNICISAAVAVVGDGDPATREHVRAYCDAIAASQVQIIAERTAFAYLHRRGEMFALVLIPCRKYGEFSEAGTFSYFKVLLATPEIDGILVSTVHATEALVHPCVIHYGFQTAPWRTPRNSGA